MVTRFFYGNELSFRNVTGILTLYLPRLVIVGNTRKWGPDRILKQTEVQAVCD